VKGAELAGLVVREGLRPAGLLTASSCGGAGVGGALGGEVDLVLGEAGEDPGEHPSDAGRVVDGLAEALEHDALGVQVVGDPDHLGEAAAEPVERGDHYDVAIADVVEQRGQAGAVELASGGLVLKDAIDGQPRLGEGVVLAVEVLFAGADSDVADGRCHDPSVSEVGPVSQAETRLSDGLLRTSDLRRWSIVTARSGLSHRYAIETAPSGGEAWWNGRVASLLMDAAGWSAIVAVVAALISGVLVVLARRQARSAAASAQAAHEQVDIMRKQLDADQQDRDLRDRPDFKVHSEAFRTDADIWRLRIERVGGPDVVMLSVVLDSYDAPPVRLRIVGGSQSSRSLLGASAFVDIAADPGWAVIANQATAELLLTSIEVGGRQRKWKRSVPVDLTPIRMV